MNRFQSSHWQEETPVLVSLVLSLSLLVVAAVTMWLWHGGPVAG